MNDDLAVKIKFLRNDSNITQEELARLANISYASIIKLENNQVANPQIDTISKIARVFGKSVDELLDFLPNSNNYKPLNIIALNSEHLISNFKNIQNHLDGKIVFPVLKSNAYGHGITHTYKKLQAYVINTYVCVDSLAEAFEIYKINNQQKVLIMGYVDPNNLNIKKLPFDYAIWSKLQVKLISKFQPTAKFHAFVDTGMNREGLKMFEVQSFLDSLTKSEKQKIVGLMSHFSSADENNDKSTDLQIKNYAFAKDLFVKECLDIKYFHIGASAAIEKKLAYDISNSYRVGLLLYGYSPINLVSKITSPILDLYSCITQIKFVWQDEPIGYNSQYKADKNTVIATLPIGYNDGIDRRLSNKGFVFVRGEACPIVGNISMNIMTVDITKVYKEFDIQIGQKVKVISSNPNEVNSVTNNAKLIGESVYVNLVGLNSLTRREAK